MLPLSGWLQQHPQTEFEGSWKSGATDPKLSVDAINPDVMDYSESILSTAQPV